MGDGRAGRPLAAQALQCVLDAIRPAHQGLNAAGDLGHAGDPVGIAERLPGRPVLRPALGTGVQQQADPRCLAYLLPGVCARRRGAVREGWRCACGRRYGVQYGIGYGIGYGRRYGIRYGIGYGIRYGPYALRIQPRRSGASGRARSIPRPFRFRILGVGWGTGGRGIRPVSRPDTARIGFRIGGDIGTSAAPVVSSVASLSALHRTCQLKPTRVPWSKLCG